jgi:Fic family protein
VLGNKINLKAIIGMINITDALNRIDEKKKKLDAARPLPPALVRNLQEWFAIEFTYTSNALEGNTLSFSETAMVVEKGITIGGKTMREHLEAINHALAIDFIEELAHKQRADIALDDILAIHKIVLQKIDDLHAGVFRKVMARISGSLTVFPNYAKIPFLMIEFMEWLHGTIDHPIIVAALAHYKLVSIHPFVDGNGRTARLLMNLLLLQYGYPLAIIKKEQRGAYIDAIEHARTTDDFVPFYEVILQAVEYTLDSYWEAISESEL